MKNFITTIMILGVVLFTACNSGASNKHQSEREHTEINQMTTGDPQHDGAHMQKGAQDEEHAMLGVKGSCEMCKERIENAAKSVEGVTFASWDMEKQELHMNFDPAKTNLEAISKVIAAAGHDTDKDKAEQAVYDALPSCCKYRE
ncbi:MAG: heavy-metal-associated domain-containing protein [Proteiniphilum sp.]|jgi:Cu(I)/Ag(I) efflux system membrane fusion protein|nr:heavy-metal-associated domain-containing protein [Proteiniphilum sp.]HHT33400.1 copper chaperone [Bacteroidales bacterium]MDD2727341.1 heavy-metal-associated domain-containing protein [Proteiniphilum sp.]MDD3333338.1 heavy-metal-associated domain-containing protein [Proteiniphilum sp.]MDD3556663.1 heavy-metal-associated domain-containing protein [Proteiniphilum sp.]